MKNKRVKEKRIGYRQVFLMICTAFWCIYPFIARLVIKKIPDVEAKFFSNTNGLIIDLLLFSKEVALVIFTGGIILYFLGERIFPDRIEKIDKTRIKNLKLPLICIGVYAAFSVLSFILSDYKETALWGANSEYEGLLAILCYLVVFVFGLYFLKPRPDQKKALSAKDIFGTGIVIVSVITAVLTLIEIYYKPILEIPFMQDLISSSENRSIARSIKNENFIGQICLTFNNPGFLGGFCALLLPVSFVISLEGKAVKRWIGIVSQGILILAVKWSDSKVAMAALIVFFPITAILSYIYISRNGIKKDGQASNTDYNSRTKKNLIVGFFAVIAIGGIMILMPKVLPTYSSRVRPEGTDTANSVEHAGSVNANDDKGETSGLYKLSKATLEDGVLNLWSGDTLLKVKVDTGKLHDCYVDYDTSDFADCLIFSDGTDVIEGRYPTVLKATNIREEKQGFKLEDERYKAISVSVDKELIIFDFGYKGTVEFYITDKGIRIFGQGSSLLEEIPQPRLTGLEKIYSFGTGRGYIWAQALPIIKDSLLVGGGNGTFAFRFRQNEIVGLLNTHGSCKYVIDRPHNWYIQIACSAGVPALIAVLVLFITYIFGFLKTYKVICTGKSDGKTGTTKETGIGSKIDLLDIGLFAGLVGFMVCGLINDSCITVNPMFWLFLGWAVGRLKTKLD